MPDSNGKIRGISLTNVEIPWHKNRVSWSQKANEDGTITRTYHHQDRDEQVTLDPRKPLEER